MLAVLLVAGLGAGSAVQLNRSLPAATLTASVAETLKIPGKAPSLPWPEAGSAEIMIQGLGSLGRSGASEPAAIGSVAKVMTAYVILKEHPLEGDEEGPDLTVSAADVADYQARIPMGQSLVPVTVGEVMTERDALEALMLPSANNVAHMLGVWDAGSQDAFLVKMNAAADDLGMDDTEYTDPSGFLPSTISTAADQVKLGQAALQLPSFAEIVALPSASIPVAGTIQNYNDLLGENGVFGIKTGSTDEAGGNLLFSAYLTVGGRKLTIVGAVFNQPGANTPEQLAEVNKVVRKLLKAVATTVKEYPLLAADPVGEVRTAWGATTTVSPASAVKVVGWPGLSVPVTVTTTAPGPTVTAGTVVGAVEAGQSDPRVRVELRSDGVTPEPSVWWRLTRTGG
ncbi:D-alanyl-D-alanine carboxypeptidase family protein [Actinoplanes sp. NPDC051494]|uniref:D-alanyl-D-alanine carboxypeptidase family protein n=1 Tax=Actinoplanes sp. NPDC051494 TaxID=3363907 RepID=UPI0037B2FE7D